MKVLITGGTGLIGHHLIAKLETRGDEVIVVSRSKTGKNIINWNPRDPDSLRIPDGTDAVIHLAGAPVFGQRWSDDYKETIKKSRTEGTRTVVNAIRNYDGNLETFVSSSATGYYGDRGDEKLTEDNNPSEDFLARVCVDWENEAKKVKQHSEVRCCIIRTGIVLSMQDGALRRMLNPFPGVWPFHWGLGGPLGFSGRQYMPWIHVEDEVRSIIHLLDNDLEGTFNLSAPNPVRNKTFTRAIGSVLNRPTVFPIPKLLMKILYGEAANILFASQRVLPEALEESGFDFQFPEVEGALEDLIV